MKALEVRYVSPDRLRPYPGNARTHSRKQIDQIARSIKRFGFLIPFWFPTISKSSLDMGVCEPPSNRLGPPCRSSLSVHFPPPTGRPLCPRRQQARRTGRLDRDILAIELPGPDGAQFDDIEVTGYTLAEIDTVLDEASEKKPEEPGPEDDIPQLSKAAT